MSKVIVITGASSGLGALTARALADEGHTVHAGMRQSDGRNAQAVEEAREYAGRASVDLRTADMDVSDQASVNAAVRRLIAESGPVDVLVHNAGHMVTGPTESFSVEQLADVYDTNVLSAQRVNRAVLPGMRERRDGLLVWVGSSSTFGGAPPYLGPYFAAKAAEDHIAKSYAVELTRFGIETSIVVPGSFTSRTEHFAHATGPEDRATADAYDETYPGLMDRVGTRLADLSPADVDITEVAQAVVRIVGTEKGKRPFRVTVDPADDGSKRVSDLADEVRASFYGRIGLRDLLVTRPV